MVDFYAPPPFLFRNEVCGARTSSHAWISIGKSSPSLVKRFLNIAMHPKLRSNLTVHWLSKAISVSRPIGRIGVMIFEL